MTRRRIVLSMLSLCILGGAAAPTLASADTPTKEHMICVVFPTDPSSAGDADGYCVWAPLPV